MAARQYYPDGSPVLCDEGGQTHTWKSKGLDVNGAGVLVNVRECLRCDEAQEKPYGAGSRRGWRRVDRPGRGGYRRASTFPGASTAVCR